MDRMIYIYIYNKQTYKQTNKKKMKYLIYTGLTPPPSSVLQYG